MCYRSVTNGRIREYSVMSSSEMRLAGICKDCMKRLGVDERLTIKPNCVHVASLQEYDAKTMAGVQFPSSSQAFGLGRGGHHGTTKITYKVAKTVKETIDDASSHVSQQSHLGSSKSAGSHKGSSK